MPSGWRRDIRQPADVLTGGASHPGCMEIRISMDRVAPSAGRLRRLDPEQASGAEDQEISFSGWLGLLRALYEVVGLPDGPAPGGRRQAGG